MDDTAIICDDVIESYEGKKFNEKISTSKTQNFYISLALLLTTITLLIAVSIYCYLTKYQAKYLLTFHNTNNKLNKLCIDSIN